MNAAGLLVAGCGGDDLREHGRHDARGGRTVEVPREKFLLAECPIRSKTFVDE
jgi:hypothetical protein